MHASILQAHNFAIAKHFDASKSGQTVVRAWALMAAGLAIPI
ncbi:hypothetical protein [Phenylobacterium montanum]|nr:hypothetical protein [Caulobacter sp. S6]